MFSSSRFHSKIQEIQIIIIIIIRSSTNKCRSISNSSCSYLSLSISFVDGDVDDDVDDDNDNDDDDKHLSRVLEELFVNQAARRTWLLELFLIEMWLAFFYGVKHWLFPAFSDSVCFAHW